MPQSAQWAGLEFPRVLEMLAGYAGSALTRDLVRGIEVVFHPARVDENLDQTAEALALRERYPTLEQPYFASLIDLQPLWERMAAGEAIDTAEVRAMRQFLEVVADFSTLRRKLLPTEFPRLADMTSAWNELGELHALTQRLFSPEGDVRDNASSKLSDIRGKLRRYEADVSQGLGETVGAVRRETGEEALLTIRSNRFVLLVPRSMLSSLQGSVVDLSGSGQSVYFEPASITRLNAERQHLFLAEQQEVRRILLEYGQRATAELPALRADLGILVRYDYVNARARFALELRATRPKMTHHAGFVLRGAVHPLLFKSFVAEDLTFEGESVLIISGVNAGGKTVLLKLLGLYSLLAALGCFVSGEAQLPYLSGVLADIGDEQSTLANLSTFTAHLQFVGQLWAELRQLSSDSPPLLALVDEIGTGTEPGEGAAFAYGLVASLLDKPVKLAVTTHYDLLKTIAYDHAGQVKNVCLQFDQERLRATFRVLDNQPGQSFALAIAERWGIAPDVLTAARSVLGQEEQRMAAIIGALEQSKVETEETRERMAAQAAELEQIRDANAQLSGELKEAKLKFAKQAEQVKGQLKSKMDELLVDAKKRLKEKGRQSVRKQDEYVKAASKSAALTRRKQDEADTVLGELLSGLELPPIEDSAPPPAVVKLGDKVALRDSRLKGVVDAVDNQRGAATLLINGKRLAVRLDQLVLDAPETTPVARPSRDPIAALTQQRTDEPRRSERSYAVGLQDSSDTLDLHGMTIEEASELLDEFISRVLLLGLPTIRVMHGIGTGRLRNFVQSYLKRHASLTKVRFAGTHDGGVGVTIADLR